MEEENGLESYFKKFLVHAVVKALSDPLVRGELGRVVRTEVEGVAESLISSGAQGRTMTVSQAAQFAGVTEGTIRDWISKKKLVALKAGNRFRIRQVDLLMSMADKETQETISVEAEAGRIVAINRRGSKTEGK